VAMAAAALARHEVNRIILTRPAVEAGERLGFLPGDLMAKVDPYLRPLFDALHDMLDPERVSQYLERGVIEIAPLAFMRGRAQPISTGVLTPSGFQQIGSLRIGDLVIGSDGRPTPVIGVYPQGRKEVVRLRTQDGASTLCCLEHLWRVWTASDRRRGKPGRVIETHEMIGRLRAAHQHRFELPLLQAPVELEPRRVPIDPYALGLLLGDGCLTTRTTPSFSTADPELAVALEEKLDGIELRHNSGVDYTLRHIDGHRGGVIVANPITVALRELGLAGTRSETKFVPEPYLHNESTVRLGVLQGLLDSDGGPVVQRARTCGYVTTLSISSAHSGGSHTGAGAEPPDEGQAMREAGRSCIGWMPSSSTSVCRRGWSRSVSDASVKSTIDMEVDARCASSMRSSQPARWRPYASKWQPPIPCMSQKISSSRTTR
jgi:phosphate starvation-inducible PhoH-like protein